VQLELQVQPRQLVEGRHVFVAELFAPGPSQSGT
jgi:hypothetical protein